MSVYCYILVMALTTYLIRVLPLTVYRKPIKSRFLRSFLAHVPYACLAAMTFPSILYSTSDLISGAAGLIAAVAMAFWKKSLIAVALAGCGAVFVAELLLSIL